jgi:hypothetical protein
MSAAIALQARELDRSIGAIILEVFIFLCRLVMVLAFMSPAVMLNLVSMQNRGPVMCLASIVLVFGAAFAVHCAIHRKAFGERAFFLIMAPVLVFMSMFTAIRNVGGIRETAMEARQAHDEAKEDLRAKRTSLTERRAAQAKLAGGEASPESIEAQIKTAKAANSKAWQASFSCNPNWITKDDTRKFCGELAKLEARKAAAIERDKLQGLIDGLDVKAEAPQASAPLGVPVSNGALLHMLDKAGFKMDGSEIDYTYETGFVLALELIAAGAPLMFGLCLPDVRRWRIEPVAAEASAEKPGRIASFVSSVIAMRKEAEDRRREAEARRREAEARRAAEAEARAKAEAEEKARAERAAKRAAAKTVEKGDPATVKAWLNGPAVVHVTDHVMELKEAYAAYAADCRAHGETPLTRSQDLAAELRKLGVEVSYKNNRGKVHGLAFASPSKAAGKAGLRVVSSR